MEECIVFTEEPQLWSILRTSLPRIRIAILPQALIVEAIHLNRVPSLLQIQLPIFHRKVKFRVRHLCDLPRLMIATQKCDRKLSSKTISTFQYFSRECYVTQLPAKVDTGYRSFKSIKSSKVSTLLYPESQIQGSKVMTFCQMPQLLRADLGPQNRP